VSLPALILNSAFRLHFLIAGGALRLRALAVFARYGATSP